MQSFRKKTTALPLTQRNNIFNRTVAISSHLRRNVTLKITLAPSMPVDNNHTSTPTINVSHSCSSSPLPSTYLDNIPTLAIFPLLASNFQLHPCYFDSLVFKQLSNAVTPAKGINQRREDHMTLTFVLLSLTPQKNFMFSGCLVLYIRVFTDFCFIMFNYFCLTTTCVHLLVFNQPTGVQGKVVTTYHIATLLVFSGTNNIFNQTIATPSIFFFSHLIFSSSLNASMRASATTPR